MNISEIVVAGAGTMGYSMAQIFAMQGFNVTVYDLSNKALDNVRAHIAAITEDLVSDGDISPTEAQSLLSKVTYSPKLDSAQGCDLVVESIIENLDIKSSFYRKISQVVGPDTILATNTSGLSINTLAESVFGPERFIGMHWFNPSNIIPLIEIVRGDATTDETTNAIRELALAIGKKPVIVNRDVPGFVANRLQFAVLREALHLVETGVVDAQGADDIMRYGLGIRYACLGPLKIADFGGLDTFHHIASYLNADLCNDPQPSALLTRLYENGSYGVKTGSGFFDNDGEAAQRETVERDEAYRAVERALYETYRER